MHISAALILEIIPPLPSLEAAPAMSLIFFVIDLTSRTKSSFLLFFGGSLYRPSTLDNNTRWSASIKTAICAARMSLSPNLISSVEVVSFSLIIGTQLKFNKFSNVAIAFLDDFLFFISEGDKRICATCFLYFLNSFFHAVINSIWPLAATAWDSFKVKSCFRFNFPLPRDIAPDETTTTSFFEFNNQTISLTTFFNTVLLTPPLLFVRRDEPILITILLDFEIIFSRFLRLWL